MSDDLTEGRVGSRMRDVESRRALAALTVDGRGYDAPGLFQRREAHNQERASSDCQNPHCEEQEDADATSPGAWRSVGPSREPGAP
jgi:hypothetical protein